MEGGYPRVHVSLTRLLIEVAEQILDPHVAYPPITVHALHVVCQVQVVDGEDVNHVIVVEMRKLCCILSQANAPRLPSDVNVVQADCVGFLDPDAGATRVPFDSDAFQRRYKHVSIHVRVSFLRLKRRGKKEMAPSQ